LRGDLAPAGFWRPGEDARLSIDEFEIDAATIWTSLRFRDHTTVMLDHSILQGTPFIIMSTSLRPHGPEASVLH